MTTKEFEIQYALGSLSKEDKIKLADNKRTSIEILTILSTDKSWTVRCNVVDNLNTPIEALKKLSKDNSWYVRSRVARNPSTPIDILKKLSTDEDVSVREYAFKLLKKGQ